MEESWESLRLELTKTLFHSILEDLERIEDPLSEFEIKLMVQKAIRYLPDWQAEWGEVDRFGKNTLLLKYKENILVVEATPVIQAIQILWNNYLESK